MQYKFTCCGHVYNARPKELDAVGQCPYCRTVNPRTEEVDKLDRVIALGKYHNHRSEVWTIVNGYGKAQVGSSTKVVKTGSIVEIPKGEQHRVVASEVGMTFIEVQLSDSQNFSEDDIVRIEDDYGRANDQQN